MADHDMTRRMLLGAMAGAAAGGGFTGEASAQSVSACRADYLANAWYDRHRNMVPIAAPRVVDPNRHVKADGRVRVVGDGTFPRAPVPALTGPIERLDPLWTYAARVGVAFGAAAPDPSFVRHEAFRAALQRECRIIGSTNGYKPETVWPSPREFDLLNPPTVVSGDRIVQFARDNRQHLRGTTMIWHEPMFLTSWVVERFFREGGRVGADMFIDAWIGFLLNRHKGRMWSWDVVNEILGWDEDSVRPVTRTSSVFSRAYGGRDTYVDRGFRLVRELDPSTRRVWCEEGLEADTSDGYFDRRRGRFLACLDKFLARGVPIQGIGLQAHLESLFDINQTKLSRFIAEIAQRGLFLEITELDVNDRNFAADDRRIANIGAVTKGFLDVMLDEPAMVNVMVWDFAWRPHGTMDAMWVNNPQAGDDIATWTRRRCDNLPSQGLPLDQPPGYQRNLMWRAMAEAFRSAPDHRAARDRIRGRPA